MQICDPYLLDNEGQSCLAILCRALRTVAPEKATPYLYLALTMSSFVANYQVDFFGPKETIDEDITYLNERVRIAQTEGVLDRKMDTPLPATQQVEVSQEEMNGSKSNRP